MRMAVLGNEGRASRGIPRGTEFLPESVLNDEEGRDAHYRHNAHKDNDGHDGVFLRRVLDRFLLFFRQSRLAGVLLFCHGQMVKQKASPRKEKPEQFQSILSSPR